MLQFSVGDHHQCHYIEIRNDSICEWNEGMNEQFSSLLIVTKGYNVKVKKDRKKAMVIIDDRQEPECSEFCILVMDQYNGRWNGLSV